MVQRGSRKQRHLWEYVRVHARASFFSLLGVSSEVTRRSFFSLECSLVNPAVETRGQ